MANAIDYDGMSREELTTLRADIDKAAALAGDRERRAAREAAAREHGFSLSELTGRSGSGRGKGRARQGACGSAGVGNKAASDMRFRNPEDHSQTWSGRGRRPTWYNEAQAAGRAIEDLKAG